MLELKSILKTNLSKNKINWLSMWAFSIKIINKYFDYKYEVKWYLKNWILFIKVTPTIAKTLIFSKKKDIIVLINNNLENFSYKNTIKDIIIK